jgi:tetratricopeptide (TPR) repeat protein
MRTALRYDQQSATLRVELATLLVRSGDVLEGIETAQEAVRIDSKNPEPHWLLANIYLEPEDRNRQVSEESLQKAVKELEAMKEAAPNDERAYYLLGDAYFKLNKPEKAIEAYEKFEELVPGVDAGYLKIADYYERAGNDQKRIEYLQKAVERNPDSPQSLEALATAYARKNRDKEAIPLLRKVLDLTNDNPLIKKQLALSLVNVGEYKEAQRFLAELKKIDPGDNSTLVLLGRAQLGERDYAAAIDTLKAVLKDDPGFLEAQFYLGSAYEQSGDLPGAVNVFSDLVAKARDGSEEYQSNRLVFQQHLASAYQEMGENEKAIAIYEEMIKGGSEPDMRVMFLLINALRIDRQFDKALALGKQYHEKYPQDAGLSLVHARTLADAGKVKEGAELLSKLLASDPSNLDTYINLSQIYLQGQRYTEAEQVLRRAESQNLDRQRIQIQFASIYEKQKDYGRAESVLNEVLKEDPKNALVLNFIGYMLADRGVRLEEAVRYIQDALAQEPQNGAYLDSLGWAYFKMNDLDKAEEYLLKAIERVKNDAVIYDHLGDLYSRKGDLIKAEEYWRRSLAHGAEQEEIKKVREKLDRLAKQKKSL